MGYGFSPDDVRFLDSPDGASVVAGAAGLTLGGPTYLADLTALRRVAGRYAAAVAETLLLRRRAAERWGSDKAGRWLFTDEALQQASPPPVAARRAGRIAAGLNSAGYRAVHDATCSIGADLVALASAGLVTIGSDLDPVRLAMARHNLAATGPAAGTTLLLRADARTAVTRGALRYADPARRDEAGRRISSADTIPSVAELDAADPHRPPVLRLPPGIDYEALARPGEIEIVSLDGSVREAVSWPEPYAAARRRATVLTTRDARAGGHAPAEELTDADPAEDDVTSARRYLVDPDPAVVRAHLVRQYAARYGLTRLDPHLAYLTGDAVPPGVRGFEVLDTAPLAERTVKEWLRRDGAGTLEIKQRGTSVIPDELRKRVRPAGDRHVRRTLVIARVGRAVRAWWCREG